MISLLLSLSQIWPVGFLLTDSCDLLPNRHGYFYTSLLFGTTKCSRLILHFSWSIPEISHFFEGFLVHWSKNGIWKARIWLKIAHCCCVWLILGPLSRQEIRNIQVCVYIYIYIHTHISVQFSSVTQWCLTLCDPMNRSTPGLSVHHQLPEFTQTHVHRVGDSIQPSHSLSSPFLPAPNPSQHQSLFQWVNSSHQVAKSFSFSISPSNEHPGLISFRMDWLDLLAVQGTLKSLLQHHSWKASILQHSAFFIVQLSQPTWLLEKPQPWLDGPLLAK